MCLSTVYLNDMTEQQILAKNVMLIECEGNSIILTDLMERKTVVEGSLMKADLTEGYVVIKSEVA